jgi:NitT/TauT family transport system permease protein
MTKVSQVSPEKASGRRAGVSASVSAAAKEKGSRQTAVADSRRAVPMIVWQLLVGLAILALWQLAAAFELIDPFFFSKPSDVIDQIGEWIASGYIWPHLAITMQEALLAFAIGVILGVVVGFLFARVPFLAKLFEPYVHMLNALPRVVLAPVLLLWFGLGIWSKVALGVTIVFFIVFFNTYRGVREVDPVLIHNARMLGASERQLLRHVFIPSALTWIFSSLHTSVGFAIVGAVVGEYLGSSRGIGYVISQAEGVFDTTAVFAGMIVLMLVVLVVDYVVNRIERRLLRWKPDEAGDAPQVS